MSEASFEKIAKILANSKFIVTAGNGGSALTASHFASDLSKLGILAYCLSDNPATITALTNDFGFEDLYVIQLKNLPIKPDVVMVFSVHGGVRREDGSLWSSNLVKLVEEAKKQGITTISITGFDGGYLKEISDYNFNVDLDDTEEVEGIHSLVAHLIVATVRDLKEVAGLKEETSTVEAYLESLR